MPSSQGEAAQLEAVFVSKAEEAVSVQRCKDMFDIVKDFPDSLPALTDLRQAVRSPHLLRRLSACLRSSVKRRLLQAGE